MWVSTFDRVSADCRKHPGSSSINLGCRPPARLECTLHPASQRRCVLAGEVDPFPPALRCAVQRRYLSRKQVGNSAARPRIAIPHFYEAALVILPYAGIDLFDRLHTETQLRRFRLAPSRAFGPRLLQHQDAPRTGLAVGAVPDLHRMISFSKAAELFARPVPIARL